MSEAQNILSMIDSVDLDHPAAQRCLDEIDARVHCYIRHLEFRGVKPRHPGWPAEYIVNDNVSLPVKEYTRSRNALKNIRPSGWGIWGMNRIITRGKWLCSLYKDDGTLRPVKIVSSSSDTDERLHPTEELAELHTIIQAIEYDRTQGGTA